MRDKIIGCLLKKLNCFENIKLKFALECLYTFLVKLAVIIFISFLLKIEKSVMLLIFLMIPLRALGFGLHANSNLQCWITSLIMYNIIPLMCSLIDINNFILIYGSFISALIIVSFAPAPTKNIPLLNKDKNLKRKAIISLIVCLYLIVIISSNNWLMKETIFLSLLYQAILVCPLTYKLLGKNLKNKNQLFNRWF